MNEVLKVKVQEVSAVQHSALHCSKIKKKSNVFRP